MPLKIIRQDITKMQVDAIVNTTNEKMVGKSGVDLAIHQAAGPLLEAECARLAPLGLGTAKITSAYNLDAKYIIHTSGPVWQGGLSGESILLKSCYTEALKVALENGCETVAFPLISSGAYGYPKDQVLKFAVQVISEFLFCHEMMVYICVFDPESYAFSQELFAEISDFIGVQYKCAEALPYRACGSGAPIEEKNGRKRSLSLQEFMKKKDKAFAYKLFDLIDARGLTDVECYKKANVDKKTFSKIKCNPDTYRPSKQTAVAFAIALKLSLKETQELLASAGMTLSESVTFDRIIQFFIEKGIYDIFEINEALFEFDQVLLGC